MTKKKNDHCIMRNSKLFCSHCGKEQDVPYPLEVEMFAAMAKTFSKIHSKCPPIWKEPEPDMQQSIQNRMHIWLTKGERGTSSETIYGRMTGHRIVRSREDHPYDAQDFHRCYKLLKFIPEWRERLTVMKEVSPQWSALVDNWDKLTELMEQLIASNWKKDVGLGKMIQELIKN